METPKIDQPEEIIIIDLPAEKPKNKGGRPLKKVDEKLIFDLASILCTYKEIASVVGCSVDLLRDRFSDLIDKGYDTGKQSLRRQMWKLANSGDRVMCIWLSKQHLDMAEKVVQRTESKVELKDYTEKANAAIEELKNRPLKVA